MSSPRKRGLIVAALGASALTGAALVTAPASAVSAQDAVVDACIEQAMAMSRYVRQTIDTPGSARERGVTGVIARIKAKSAACVDVLFRDGTAENPNAGILGGDGFSYSLEGSCTGTAPCNGGNAGKLEGDGGDGWNGGTGGNAGWYGGIAGNGGDAGEACTDAECRGGAGGRAGRYGIGGAGGDGIDGHRGGDGGNGGLLRGTGGNGGNGGDAGAGDRGGHGGNSGNHAQPGTGVGFVDFSFYSQPDRHWPGAVIGGLFYRFCF